MADRDILIGPGKLYRAPLGEANPDESTIDFGEAWGGNWVDMGDLIEGQPVTLSNAEEVTKVYTERSTAPVNAVRTRRECMIKAGLAEHSVANIAVLFQGTTTTTAAAGGGQKGYSEVTIGSQSEMDFYKWGIEGFRKDANDNAQPIRYFFHKGFARLSGDTAFAKQNPTAVPIEVTVLADRSQAVGSEIGVYQAVTAAATAT